MRLFSLGILFWILAIVIALVCLVWFVSIFNKNKGGRRSNSISQTQSNSNSMFNAPTQTTMGTSNTKVCPNCNTPISDGISFCMMCGTKVK